MHIYLGGFQDLLAPVKMSVRGNFPCSLRSWKTKASMRDGDCKTGFQTMPEREPWGSTNQQRKSYHYRSFLHGWHFLLKCREGDPETDGIPELRRQNWKSKDIKAPRIHKVANFPISRRPSKLLFCFS